MNIHLDVFLTLLAVVGFGHATDLFRQNMQQQQQQNLGGIGGSFPRGLDGALPGVPGGRPREGLGSGFGLAPGELGIGGTRGSSHGRPGSVSGIPNGGGMGVPGLGGPFDGGRAPGALSPGGGLPGGRGSGPGIFGGSSRPGVGGGFPAGAISGSRGTSELPGLEGGAPSPSDALSALGSGSSNFGGMAGPPLSSGNRGPGQHDSGTGLLGAPAGPFGGNRGSPDNQGSAPSSRVPGPLGFPAGPSGTGGGAPGSFGGPEGVPPSSGGFGNPSASGTGGFGSGTGEGSSFGLSASAPEATGSGGSLSGQPEQGNNLPSPVGGGVEPGFSGSPLAVSPSSSGSTGLNGVGANGAPGGRGPTATGPQGSGVGIGGSPISGSGASGTRPGRKPHKPLTQTEKAAIGLGVTGGLFALSALGAAIASAVHTAQQRKPSQGKPGGGPRTGCLKPSCTSGGRRERRSIQESKVPAEVLNSIPTDFERLY